MTSSRCAGAIVAQLCAQGVTDAVLAPGSRSAPLALALASAETEGRLRLHVRFDERSAGFLALGLAKASGRPVPVVTTSGTAVGNLMPAVMESHHGGVPLLVISADRPAALVGFGANQTTDQSRLFSPFVRWSARVSSAAAAASWAAQTARGCLLASGLGNRNPGPVHLNVEFDQPLVGDQGWPPPASAVVQEPAGVVEPVVLATGPRTLVICGDASVEVGRQAARLASEGGLPLVAEPSSNARAAALRTGRLLLGSPLAAAVERVVVFGHPTLSRPVNQLLARDDVEVVVVSAAPEWPDAGWRASRVVPAVRLESESSGTVSLGAEAAAAREFESAGAGALEAGSAGGAALESGPAGEALDAARVIPADAGISLLRGSVGTRPLEGGLAGESASESGSAGEAPGAAHVIPADAGISLLRGSVGTGRLEAGLAGKAASESGSAGEAPDAARVTPADAGISLERGSAGTDPLTTGPQEGAASELGQTGRAPLAVGSAREAALGSEPARSVRADRGTPREWLGRWQAADASLSARVDDVLAAQPVLTGPVVAASVLAFVGDGVLMLGNSQPIRDADLAPDHGARVFANRGLAGIDGTISSAIGIALASAEPVTLLCGDLTFLHDGNGLAAGLGERRPDLRIVVADDSGGSIFATLEYGDSRYAQSFERVFATPPGVDLVRLAEAHGVPARRVRTTDELVDALARPIRGLEVVVATVDRAGRRALNDQLNALAGTVE